jgi:starch synthase
LSLEAQKNPDLYPVRIATVQAQGLPQGSSILESSVPGTSLRLWLVDIPPLFEREGSPYCDEQGKEWLDNAERYCYFSRVVTEIAIGNTDIPWRPDIVHCNDWPTALIPAFLSLHSTRPAVLFTIHNLAYQGNFPADMMSKLSLPQEWWDYHRLEFYGQLSFIKAGIIFADVITTVSPTYANEILLPENGCRLDGLLLSRKQYLHGILNGIDTTLWNPDQDPRIHQCFNSTTLNDKANNKLFLQKQLGFARGKSKIMVGFIARLVYQKGINLLIKAIEHCDKDKYQWVILGSGDQHFQQKLLELQKTNPANVFCSIRYSEALAHQIEASADIFLMPSIYEPCGLNQIYSLKYGTIPIVSATGGLVDTVVDANKETIKARTATGFCFESGDLSSLIDAIERASACFKNKTVWRQLQSIGMQCDFSWEESSKAYLACYQDAQQNSARI